MLYFKNFYAFRFFAAVAVMVLHVQLMGLRLGWTDVHPSPAIELLSLGVDFFFVLSGFLITALLCRAIDSQSFSLKSFYLRRALRIFPLYYLVVFVVFFLAGVMTLPDLPGMDLRQDYGLQLLLHLVLLPQVAKSFLVFVPYGGQLWTIGVEVMFYALWPLLIRWRPRFSTCAVVGIGWVCVKAVALFGLGGAHPVSQFLAMSRFEVLAIGGCAFFIVRRAMGGVGSGVVVGVTEGRRADLEKAGRWWWYVCLFLFVVSGVTWLVVDDLLHVVVGLAFGALLISSSLGGIKVGWFESRIVRFLGEISYGIYLWHFLAIGLVAVGFRLFGHPASWVLFWICVYVGSVLLTALMSVASFMLVERPINSFRNRF